MECIGYDKILIKHLFLLTILDLLILKATNDFKVHTISIENKLFVVYIWLCN